MDTIYAVASNCSSVVYGNIAQHTKELVKSIFPQSYFKYEMISSEIAYRNIRRQLKPNTRNELAKREKPYLIIRPVFSVPDEMYLYETPLTMNMDHVETSIDRRHLFPIIQDTDRGIGLSYKLNRDKIEFQVTVTVSTAIQQIDIYKSLVNQMFWARPFTKRCPMESMIPRGIIKALANTQNINIDHDTYAAGPFLEALNQFSNYPITYKLRNSTAKDEYFMYSNQEVLFTFDDLQIQEGSRKNMADDAFEISFRVVAEFNLPGLFVLFGSSDLKERAMGSIVIGEMSINGGTSFPLFTLENLFGDQEDANGFRKFRSSILQPEKDSEGNDVTCFETLLNDEMVSCIRAYITSKCDISTLIRLQLFKNRDSLTEGLDYVVDWYKLQLTTYKPSLEDSYRMILYVNTIKINQLLVDATDRKSSDSPGLVSKS